MLLVKEKPKSLAQHLKTRTFTRKNTLVNSAMTNVPPDVRIVVLRAQQKLTSRQESMFINL